MILMLEITRCGDLPLAINGPIERKMERNREMTKIYTVSLSLSFQK